VGVGAGVSVGGIAVASGVAVMKIMVASAVGVTALGSLVAAWGSSEQDMSTNARMINIDKFRLFLTVGVLLVNDWFPSHIIVFLAFNYVSQLLLDTERMFVYYTSTNER
jgi:hypothetical protein